MEAGSAICFRSMTTAPDSLLAWIKTESPTHNRAGVNLMMDLVSAGLEEAPVGSSASRASRASGILVLRTGPERDEAILAMSHLDTVHPVGTLERDLPVRLDGDRLYGPGVYDTKEAPGSPWRPSRKWPGRTASRPIVFLVTPDEEIGSPISRSLIEDFGAVQPFALVTEPARDGGKIVTSRKGIGRFEVHVEGRPAHSGSRHEDGRSAIREAARQVLAIEE